MTRRPIKNGKTPVNPSLYLGDSLSTGGVASLASELLSLMEQAQGGLAFDASGTEMVSTAGAQLLVMLDRELQARGASLSIQDAPENFCQSMQSLGLGDHLNRWMAA